MTKVAAIASVVAVTVFAAPMTAQIAAADRAETQAAAATGVPRGRPFKGVRFFYVPSQDRYRAVKFSPKSPYHPAGFAAGAYSKGPGGASCFRGQKRGSTYVGTLYSLPTGPEYTRSYTLNDLFFGQVTYSAPASFKRKARAYLNGNGVCAVW